MTSCPPRDSLRSVYLWFVLCALLVLRRANRTRAAWAVLLPLLAVYIILHVVETTVNSHILWTGTPYLCSLACEMLRSLALGLAVLLAVSDLIKVRHRFLRATLIFSIIVFAGSAAMILNAPLSMVTSANSSFALNASRWSIVFGFMVLVFMIGLSIIAALLRRFTGRNTLTQCAGVCLILGVASVLILAGVKLLSGSVQLLSSQQSLLTLGALLQPFLAPYFVFFWFVLLALQSPFYHRRFTSCLTGGSSPSQSEPADHSEPPHPMFHHRDDLS